MQKKITETTAPGGLNIPPGKKLFKVPTGEFAGRMLAVFQSSSSEIKFSYADKPYLNWCSPVTLATDAAAFSFDAAMDTDGNVHVAYTQQTTNYLVTRKLAYTGGIWAVGSLVFAYNGSATIAPSIVAESVSKLWVSWSRLNNGFYDIQVKSSEDGGQTWGTGSGDTGVTLKTGLSAGISKIVRSANAVQVVYTGTWSDIFIRSRLSTGSEWSAEYVIATGTSIDQHFDIALSSDGLLGVVYDDNQLRYREFDGTNWSATITLDNTAAYWPQLRFVNNVPVVVYLGEPSDGQVLMKYVHRATGVFSEPELLDTRAGSFDSVTLYHAPSGSYADLTAAAADTDAGDVVHPTSAAMVLNTGDCLFLGMNRPFRYVKIIQQMAGSGGSVTYSYWNGTIWQGFTPLSGMYHLDATDKSLLLWEDYSSIPVDWQKTAIDGSERLWVRVEVVGSFSTGPVGSQITAVSEIQALIVRR